MTQHGRLPSASGENEPYGAVTIDFNPLEGVQGGLRHPAPGKSGGTGLQRVRYFQELLS